MEISVRLVRRRRRRRRKLVEAEEGKMAGKSLGVRAFQKVDVSGMKRCGSFSKAESKAKF